MWAAVSKILCGQDRQSRCLNGPLYLRYPHRFSPLGDQEGIWWSLGLLALCSMFMYGATSILTSVIPQECPMPSTAAGFIDFVVYLGAGLSGIITGIVSERYQWTAVPALWVGALLLAGVGILLIHRRKESLVSMGEGKASVN